MNITIIIPQNMMRSLMGRMSRFLKFCFVIALNEDNMTSCCRSGARWLMLELNSTLTLLHGCIFTVFAILILNFEF